MDGQDRRHVLECRPKVQGGPDGHSHQWLHSVFPATLVLVEQKVKVSLPSASNSLLTDCIARGPRPRDIKAHISIQAAPQRLGLRALLAQALLVGKRRAVSLRRPPPPPPPELSKAVCGNGYEGHGAVRAPAFLSQQTKVSPWTGSASSGGESGLLPDTQMVAA